MLTALALTLSILKGRPNGPVTNAAIRLRLAEIGIPSELRNVLEPDRVLSVNEGYKRARVFSGRSIVLTYFGDAEAVWRLIEAQHASHPQWKKQEIPALAYRALVSDSEVIGLYTEARLAPGSGLGPTLVPSLVKIQREQNLIDSELREKLPSTNSMPVFQIEVVQRHERAYQAPTRIADAKMTQDLRKLDVPDHVVSLLSSSQIISVNRSYSISGAPPGSGVIISYFGDATALWNKLRAALKPESGWKLRPGSGGDPGPSSHVHIPFPVQSNEKYWVTLLTGFQQLAGWKCAEPLILDADFQTRYGELQRKYGPKFELVQLVVVHRNRP